MSYFDWIKLGRGNGGGGKVGRNPDNTSGETPSQVEPPFPKRSDKHEQPNGLHGKGYAQPFFDLLLVIFTGGLVWVGLQQAHILNRQAGIQSRQADISSNQLALENAEGVSSSEATSASLNISGKIADAEVNQAKAMKQMAGAADRQATAAAKQAAAASSLLALAQAPNLDLVIDPIPYEDYGPFKAEAVISNRGTYTVRRVRIFAWSALLTKEQIPTIWKRLVPVRTINVVPGGNETAHHQPIGISNQISQGQWLGVLSGQLEVVQAMRIVFEDAGGTTRSIDACIAYGGPPPGYVQDRDCQERK